MLWRDPVATHIFFTFFRGCEGNPLSPPAEEAAQGQHPLDSLSFSPVSKEIFSSTFSEELSHFFRMPLRRELKRQNIFP
jgi:hypothetical protein